jgi:acyl carrier protein
MSSDTLTALQPIFREVFENKDLVITEHSNASTVDGWDSLAHVNLIMAVESAFNVRFALGELEELQCVGDMVALIERKRNS